MTEVDVQTTRREAVIAAVQKAAPSLRPETFLSETWREIEDLWIQPAFDAERILLSLNQLLSKAKDIESRADALANDHLARAEALARRGRLADHLRDSSQRGVTPMPAPGLPAGCALGLGASEQGGDGLAFVIEARPRKGAIGLTLTGGLPADGFADSAEIAFTLACNRFDFSVAVHLNTCGPRLGGGSSGGLAFFLALASLANGRPLPAFAATGALNLRGEVLPVGGLEGKLFAAYRDGIERVLIPVGNEKDVSRYIPLWIQSAIEIIPVKNIDGALVSCGF